MKLIVADAKAPVQFRLQQDVNDINVLINDEVVAYFEEVDGKVRLLLIHGPACTDVLSLKGDHIEVVA